MDRAGNLACFDLLLIVLRRISAIRFPVFVGHYFALLAINPTIFCEMVGCRLNGSHVNRLHVFKGNYRHGSLSQQS
jgi:hypothetical protein